MSLKAGFDLLKQERYQEASEYFIWKSQMAFSQRPFDSKQYNSCLYGQARALIGLKEYQLAAEILRDLIHKAPKWEAPYITLARLWEQLGFPNVAEYIFGGALIATDKSAKLRQHYVWFLKEHLAEDGINYKRPPTFTPGFTATTQTQDDSEQMSMAEKLEQLSLDETNRSIQPNK